MVWIIITGTAMFTAIVFCLRFLLLFVLVPGLMLDLLLLHGVTPC